MCNKRKLLIALFNKIAHTNFMEAIEQMWCEGFLDIKALERLYISVEVERRVRAGEGKTKAMEQLAAELACSFEKIRAAVYSKNFKRKENGNTN